MKRTRKQHQRKRKQDKPALPPGALTDEQFAAHLDRMGKLFAEAGRERQAYHEAAGWLPKVNPYAQHLFAVVTATRYLWDHFQIWRDMVAELNYDDVELRNLFDRWNGLVDAMNRTASRIATMDDLWTPSKTYPDAMRMVKECSGYVPVEDLNKIIDMAHAAEVESRRMSDEASGADEKGGAA